MPACWNRLLTALNGAVAIVGIPNWVNDEVIVFKGMEAKLKAPPTKPCTWLKGPAPATAAAPAGAPAAAPAAAPATAGAAAAGAAPAAAAVAAPPE